MSNEDYPQWRGFILVTAGILWVVSSMVHPSDFDQSGLFNPFWIPNAILIALAYLLIPFGLVGIQSTLADQPRKHSRIGFDLAIGGSLTSVLTSLVFGFVAPDVARQQNAPTSLFDLIQPGGRLMWGGMLLLTYVLLFLPGCILVARTVILESALPRAAGWGLAIGLAIFSLGRMIPQLFILTSIGGLIFGIALAWLGYALWSNRGKVADSPTSSE